MSRQIMQFVCLSAFLFVCLFCLSVYGLRCAYVDDAVAILTINAKHLPWTSALSVQALLSLFSLHMDFGFCCVDQHWYFDHPATAPLDGSTDEGCLPWGLTAGFTL